MRVWPALTRFICALLQISSPFPFSLMSSVAARLEARAAVGSSLSKADNATISSSNHAESSTFLTSFEESKKQIENAMSALAAEKEASFKAGTEDATLDGLKEKLAGLNARLVTMQQDT